MITLELGSAFGIQARFAGIGELVDDLNAVLPSPFADLVALDRDRFLLPVLGRLPIVGHGPRSRSDARNARAVKDTTLTLRSEQRSSGWAGIHT